MYAVVQRPLAVHVSVPTCRNACSLHLRHLCRLGTSSLASSPRRLLPRLSEAAAAPALAAAAAPEPWTVLAVLAACSAGAQWLEGHTPWGAALSSPLLALLGGAAAHGLGLLPSSGPLLDVIWSYVMPLAAGLFVLEHDVTRLVSEGAPLLASFLLGAAGMVVGAALAWALVGRWMGPQGPALAACLTASYVGGTINFIATAQAVGLPAWCFPAAMAADNLAMAALLMVSLGLPLGSDNNSSSNWDSSSTGAAGHTSQGTLGSLSASSSSSNNNGTDSIGANRELSGGKRSNSSAAAGGSGQGQGDGHPRSEANSRTAVHRSSSGRARGSPSADGPLATDGGALLTAVPPTAAVFAAITAAARGESRAGTGASTITPPPSAAPPGSSSSGECSEAGGPVAAQQPTSVLDAPPVIPDGWWPLVPSNSSSSSSSSSGGGTLPDGSGATALSGDALLTAAPDPADLAKAVAAARRGASAVQRRSLSSLSSWDEGTEGGTTTTTTSNSSMDGASSSNSRGDRQQLWGRYAPGSPRQAAAASSGSLQRPQVLREVGLLAPDGGPLLTEDPPAGAVAAAVARARSGDTTASVSVSSTASGSFDDQDQVADTPSSSSSRRSSSNNSSSTDIPSRSREASNNTGEHNSSTHQPVNQGSRSVQEPVTTMGGRGTRPAPAPLTPQSAAASLAAATLSAAGARGLCAALGCPALFLMVLSLLAAGASWGAHATQAAALRRHQQQQQQQQGSAVVQSSVPSPFAGSTALASALVGLFFAALGASCGALPDPGAAAPLLAFIAIMAGVHGVVMVGVGRGLLRLEPRVLLLGSNANIGGPATAAGLAAARGWGSLVQPALLVGALGYALGTSAGLGVAGWTGALAAAAPAVA